MEQIIEALTTSAGLLWKTFWALVFGYTISAGIQVLVSRAQMARTLGERGARQGMLASFFGFISSSCSFAALAASRSVLVKGAHPVNALAFLIASTNLVIELGIVLWILLGWHFFLGNILLGLLMIIYAYLLTSIWFPAKLAAAAGEHAEQQQREEGMQESEDGDQAQASWRDKVTSRAGWQAIADAFFMEWKMPTKKFCSALPWLASFRSLFPRASGIRCSYSPARTRPHLSL